MESLEGCRKFLGSDILEQHRADPAEDPVGFLDLLLASFGAV
jgi:hypothetical protein